MSEQSPQETRPIVDIELARFNEALAPDYEQYWYEIMEALNAATSEYSRQDERVKTLFHIWGDEKMPQVYRDRAMIELDRRYYVFEHEDAILRPGWGSILEVCQFSEEDKARRDSWFLDALRYSQENDEQILSEHKQLFVAFDSFGAGDMDQEELESILDSLDVMGLVPEYRRDDVDKGYRLLTSGLSILDHTIMGVFGRNKEAKMRIKAWGEEQLRIWLGYKEGEIPKEDLPSWLAEIDDDDDRKTDFFFIVMQRNAGGHQLPLSEDIYERAVELYGWGALLQELDIKVNPNELYSYRLGFGARPIYLREMINHFSDQAFIDKFWLHYVDTVFSERERLRALPEPSVDSVQKRQHNKPPFEEFEDMFVTVVKPDFWPGILARLPADYEFRGQLEQIAAEVTEARAARDEREKMEREEGAKNREAYQQKRLQEERRREDAADRLAILLSIQTPVDESDQE